MLESHAEKINSMPLIAILRGITPDEAIGVSDALVDAGLCFMEVTLNSPQWQRSLKIIEARHGDAILLGAGTVLSEQDVDNAAEAGARVIISPNMNTQVIKRSTELGLLSVPGCFTPSECFAALDAGADVLKIFPADSLGVGFIKALSAVLPAHTALCPTGGVSLDNMEDFIAAGVFAMGIGSALYQPGKSIAEVAIAAQAFADRYRQLGAVSATPAGH